MLSYKSFGLNETLPPPSCVFLLSRFDLRTLPVDFVECLMRFQPTENEIKILRQFEKERKPLESLTDEDRFMMQFSKIERLMQKMTIMAFIGNFCESIQMLTPVSFGQLALSRKPRKACFWCDDL